MKTRNLAILGLSAATAAVLALAAWLLAPFHHPAPGAGPPQQAGRVGFPSSESPESGRTELTVASGVAEPTDEPKDTATARADGFVHRPGIDELLLYPTNERALTPEQAWELVDSARSGDATAQASLGRQLGFCKELTRVYPDEGSLEAFRGQAIQSEVTLGDDFWHDLQNQLDTCWRLQAEVAGPEREPVHWLRRGASKGHGPALAFLAESRLMQLVIGENGSPEIRSDPAAARSLFDAAARTRNPQALFTIGLNMQLNDGEYSAFPGHTGAEALQWMYAACHFGLDCSRDNDWLRAMCRMGSSCGRPYASDLISYLEHNLFTGLERDVAIANAPELIRVIETGEWNRLDLTRAGDPGPEEALRGSNSGAGAADAVTGEPVPPDS